MSTDQYPNGALPANALVDVSRHESFVCLVSPEMAECWTALRDAVEKEFDVQLVVLGGGAYRDLDAQVRLFNERYEFPAKAGQPADHYRTWNGKQYSLRPGLASAASPGTSNHGRGAAVDIAILAQNKAVGITSNPGVLPWLIEHADEYGLSWELQSEPWHLRVVGPVKVKPVIINHLEGEEAMVFKTTKTGEMIFTQDAAKAVRHISGFEGAVAEATGPGWAADVKTVDVADDVAVWLKSL